MTFKLTKRCCYVGYIVQALVINFAPLLFVIFRDTYKINYALIGTIVFINFLTQLSLDVISVFCLDRIGYRASAVISHFCCAAGFVLLGILPEIMNPFWGICLSTTIYSIGAGIIEVVINPIVTGLPAEYNGNLMLTHSFYCWGQLLVVLITTTLLKVIGIENWRFVSVIWAIIPFINGILFMKTPIAEPVEKEKQKSEFSIFSDKIFLVFLFMMLCAGGSELAMSQWASTFVQTALGVDKALGDLLGPCLFAFFMGVGRLIYGLYENKINAKKYMIASCLLCIICYVVTALSKNAYISLAGCSICGFAISTLWPGTVSLAAKRFPRGSGSMYSAIAIFGDIGCSVAPFLTGLVASMRVWGENALRAGLVINIIYPVGFILAVFMLAGKKRNNM